MDTGNTIRKGNDPIQVLVVEDYEMMRQLIWSILAAEDDIEIAGEATDGLEALELVQQLRPNVVIMDLALPRLGGIQVMQQIRALVPGTQVLFVSVHDQIDLVQGAVEAGAKGYLQKQTIFKELVPAVRAVSEGRKYFSATVADYIK
jgi:DNA-binding NarL/FixJ family response regulator